MNYRQRYAFTWAATLAGGWFMASIFTSLPAAVLASCLWSALCWRVFWELF